MGAGPTGVELAGSLCEIARDALPRDFRTINTEEAQVFLVEGTDRVLPTYPRSLSRAAARQLAQLGATIRTRTMVTEIDADAAYFHAQFRRTNPLPYLFLQQVDWRYFPFTVLV